MKAQDRALWQIRQLCETYSDPDSAYVARSRLQRALLSALEFAAREAGARGPAVPGPFELPEHASEETKGVVEACNSIWSMSETMCQPSEALDVRWTKGWHQVVEALGHLTHRIRALGDGVGRGSAV